MSKITPSQLAGTNMLYGRYSFQYFLDSMQRIGINNIEIYGVSPHFHFYDSEDPMPLLKRQIKDSGLKVISMMPEENVYPVNIAAREKRLRDNTVELYKRFMDAAAELDCYQMLLCPGRPYRDEPFSVGFEYARDSICRLLEHSRQTGVALCYETLRIGESTLSSNLEDLALMVETVNDPYLQVCVDTVPVYSAGEKVRDYFARLGDKITHFHINDGAPHGHLMWGDGTQNVDEHLDALREFDYSRYITMETGASRYMHDPERFYRMNYQFLSWHMDEE